MKNLPGYMLTSKSVRSHSPHLSYKAFDREDACYDKRGRIDNDFLDLSWLREGAVFLGHAWQACRCNVLELAICSAGTNFGMQPHFPTSFAMSHFWKGTTLRTASPK